MNHSVGIWIDHKRALIVSRWHDAHVVKAFNTVGNPFMFRPDFPGGLPDMFIAGNSDDASSRHLEAMCMVWVLSAIRATVGTRRSSF